VVTEALGWPNHGEPHKILPLFNENRIGWHLGEIGADSNCATRAPVADQTKALCPVIARPTISVFISRVPSYE
jgi:hypothetical protein